MCRRVYLRFRHCPCELQSRVEECCFGSSDARCQEIKVTDKDNTTLQVNKNHFVRRPSRRGGRNTSPYHTCSPYHESPIDLDKYDKEMGRKLQKDGTGSADDDSHNNCSRDRGGKAVGSQCGKGNVKKAKPLHSRPLASGCAANFEIFGQAGLTSSLG
ncbi:hypothetical protein F4808DRAFT_466172 [Astrocystis sublimbata]|nr:hypothetical protein F4808DRAFT_466172 [Astrocystis sublimbata]